MSVPSPYKLNQACTSLEVVCKHSGKKKVAVPQRESCIFNGTFTDSVMLNLRYITLRNGAMRVRLVLKIESMLCSLHVR